MPGPKLNRRRFLYGIGGAAVALPALEALQWKTARAAETAQPRYFVAMRQANGCAQATDGEPDRFWPTQHGPLTEATMTGRAVDELLAYKDDLLILSGTRYAFESAGCGHSGGGNQCLTAARVTGSGPSSLADGESIDNLIARKLNDPGVEPLTLYSGPKGQYITEVLSYRGPQDLRGAENNPWSVYQKLFGLIGTDGALIEQLQTRRKSVNDLVRDQMQALLGRSDLSTNDRRRLELHFGAIRDLEVQLSCALPPAEDLAAMEAMEATATDSSNREAVARMHGDLIALAFACDLTRAATLQIGGGNDSTQYTIDGQTLPSFHMISHRIYSDGSEGDPIPNADILHHEIDRLHARMFKHLLDRLATFTTPTGRLLDDCVALWTNDVADRYHGYGNLPQVIAGSGGGYLKTGIYVDAGEATNNKLFNTIANAVGVTKDDGSPVDDFGDASLERGEIAQIKAS